MKRIISAILAFVLLLGCFNIALAATSLDDAMRKAHLYPVGTGNQLLVWNTIIGDDFAPQMIMYRADDGNEYPAYCLNPNREGVHTGHEYDVGIDDALDNPQVWGAIMNGYPYKTPAELGVSTVYEAYYATKMAIWTIVHNYYSDVTKWTANGAHNEPVLAAMNAIYSAGMATATIPQSGGAVSATGSPSVAGPDGVDGNYLSQTFTVSPGVAYSVTLGSGAPAGAMITDEQNNPKSDFQAGEKFKVLIPLEGPESGGSFNLNLTAQGAANAVLWGQSYNAQTQDYAVVAKGLPQNTQATASYMRVPGDDTTPGKLLIRKVEYGTTKGLAGAVFRVTDADGGIVGDYITDGNGQITVVIEDLGAYYVDEIVAPAGFQIDENSHKDIVITATEDAILTFANKPVPEIEIVKIDADTGETLPGAVIRVAYDGGSQFFDVRTDATGKARLSDLWDGTWTAVEVAAPNGYELDPTPVSVKLEAGKLTTITLTNHRKPGIEILKVDEDTGLPLENAEFSVEKLDGGIVHQGLTGKDGKISLEGLAPGWYRIYEMAAPRGYLKDPEPRIVQLLPGAFMQIKFDNRLRPSLQILKIDAQTGLPLAGAVFHVQKTESATVSEYVTDASGRVIIHDLDEAVYSVVEVKAPDNYLLDEQHRDIALEWGTTKTLVFTNKARPSLEILKIDEETKLPLVGAKIRITATESATVGEYVTDASGRILLTGLNAEIYTVEEIVAPSGYLLEPQHTDILLEWGTTKQVILTNKARPKLRILKVDVITGETLPNAEFRIEKVEDKTVSEYITDSSGEILIENLDEAIYRATEFMPPDGYLRYDESKEISLEWGKTKTLKFDNIRKPTLIVTKINGLTYQPVPNATFTIDYEDANGGVVPLGTFRTDLNGQIIIPKVEPGWYIITETVPAPGFSLPSNPVTRKYLAPGENAYTNFSMGGSVGDTGGDNITAMSGADFSAMAAASGEEIIDYPLNSIVIRKAHAITGELLAGAAFELRKVTEDVSGGSGAIIGRYTTDNSGVIVITGLQPGGYIIEEVQAPANYLISENSQQQAWLKPDGTSIVEVTFANYPYGSLLIAKVDALTNKPLANAKFRVTDGSGAVAGNSNGEFVTDANGEILIPDIKPGNYVVTEIEAPPFYSVDTTPQTVQVGVDGKTYKVSFKDQLFGGIVIRKLDSVTREPLSGAEFKVTASDGSVIGTVNGVFRTDASGTVKIPNLSKGSYVIGETKAPDDYILENQTQTIAVDYGKTYTVDFYNSKMSGLQIIKIDATTKQPLKGAKFTVYRQSGEVAGNYETDGDGVIIIPMLTPGWYKAVETKAPEGWLPDDTPQDFEITANQFVKLVFENKQLSSLQIRKVSEPDGSPLPGAVFEVRRQNGEVVGEFTTDASGSASIPNAAPGWYVVSEIKAPQGFILDSTAKTVEVKPVTPTVVTFTNKPLSGIEIIKTDAITHAPLSGVTFVVERVSGERVGTFKTDTAGKILVSGLNEDSYIIYETIAPSGYILDSTPQTVTVKSGKLTVAEFGNKALSGLQIVKLDSKTSQPIAGVEFSVSKMDGEMVGAFTTAKDGTIYISELDSGWYVVVETKSADGYLIDSEPRNVEITYGKAVTLTVENTPVSGLLIVKTDAATGKPLAGVVFDVTLADGQRVSGDILDGNQPNTEANSPNKNTSPNGDISGSYTTDAQGRILINTLPYGEYHITERKPLDGYELDETVHSVTVTPGKLATLQITNKQKAGLRLLKIDSVTKLPIFGTEFMVFDANGKVVGNYTTDNNGIIDFAGILTEGRYTIRETRPAEGYYRDDVPRTVEFVSGKVTEIVWQNTPQTGQIQITKLSGDANEVNGLDAGTPLAGAIFEVYAYKSGNLIDRFVSGSDGRAVSKPLPLGRYLVKEVTAPQWYKISTETLDIEIEFATQIIKREFLNYSANTGVTIRKTGPVEVMPGDTIRYDIKEVRNTSTVPLTDFYWRDILPVDAVRLTKIVTGTYNQALKYKVLATTNRGDTIIAADNLSTTVNNVVDCRNAALGLMSDEYVTSFTLIFGTVKAGFAEVEKPQIYAKVLDGLPNKHEFANKVDVGGKYYGEWVVGKSVWIISVYNPAPPKKLPRTGY